MVLKLVIQDSEVKNEFLVLKILFKTKLSVRHEI